jgi:hypothetical protein
MSFSLVSSKQPPPPADREALAQAIEDAGAAAAQLEKHKQAIIKTRSSLRRAETAHEVAVTGVDKAISEHADNIAAAAADDDADDVAPSSSLIRMARLAITDAADEVESFKAAYDRLRKDLPLYEEALRQADVGVETAISEILKVALEPLLAQAQQAWATLEPLKRALEQAVTVEGPTGAPWEAIVAAGKAAKPLDAVRDEIRRFLQISSYLGDGKTKPNAFLAARLALKQDAFTVLPDFAASPASPDAA